MNLEKRTSNLGNAAARLQNEVKSKKDSDIRRQAAIDEKQKRYLQQKNTQFKGKKVTLPLLALRNQSMFSQCKSSFSGRAVAIVRTEEIFVIFDEKGHGGKLLWAALGSVTGPRCQCHHAHFYRLRIIALKGI